MIESIQIKDDASFGSTPELLSGLFQFNFIFGANGTGKTTISRVIADESKFPSCSVVWRGGTKMETLVYNRDFVDRNFGQSTELKGIFTLGEKDKSTLDKITAAKGELDGLVGKIQQYTKTLQGDDGNGGKKGELAALEAAFEEQCWTQKVKHDLKLQGAFQGVRGKKRDFKDRLLSDGSDAKDTLSEGEANFITFLYFYHLLKGSVSETGMTTNRVVVFDDPVSSLDSDVLFIVSSLIKGIFEEVRAGHGNVKQVFVLTHNVYFHKEVSFNPRRTNVALKEETFWIVKKPGVNSLVEKHASNPIKTSYELLWVEVRSPNRSNLSIQNTLRRILENYFKILGNVDPDSICDKFVGKEKLICKSLFSWVNEGSHSVHDDLYVSIDGNMVDNYLLVFKKIFEKCGHLPHYEMMMGDAVLTPPTAPTAKPATRPATA